MRKILSLLVVLLVLVAIGNAQGTVIKKGKLKDQTAPIPETVIVTPTTDGLFRFSVYGTITTADPSSSSEWIVNLIWNDDSGSETGAGTLGGFSCCVGPFYDAVYNRGYVTVIEAKAGTPISFSVTQSGSPDISAYSLYYTLERLE